MTPSLTAYRRIHIDPHLTNSALCRRMRSHRPRPSHTQLLRTARLFATDLALSGHVHAPALARLTRYAVAADHLECTGVERAGEFG